MKLIIFCILIFGSCTQVIPTISLNKPKLINGSLNEFMSHTMTNGTKSIEVYEIWSNNQLSQIYTYIKDNSLKGIHIFQFDKKDSFYSFMELKKNKHKVITSSNTMYFENNNIYMIESKAETIYFKYKIFNDTYFVTREGDINTENSKFVIDKSKNVLYYNSIFNQVENGPLIYFYDALNKLTTVKNIRTNDFRMFKYEKQNVYSFAFNGIDTFYKDSLIHAQNSKVYKWYYKNSENQFELGEKCIHYKDSISKEAYIYLKTYHENFLNSPRLKNLSN